MKISILAVFLLAFSSQAIAQSKTVCTHPPAGSGIIMSCTTVWCKMDTYNGKCWYPDGTYDGGVDTDFIDHSGGGGDQGTDQCILNPGSYTCRCVRNWDQSCVYEAPFEEEPTSTTPTTTTTTTAATPTQSPAPVHRKDLDTCKGTTTSGGTIDLHHDVIYTSGSAKFNKDGTITGVVDEWWRVHVRSASESEYRDYQDDVPHGSEQQWGPAFFDNTTSATVFNPSTNQSWDSDRINIDLEELRRPPAPKPNTTAYRPPPSEFIGPRQPPPPASRFSPRPPGWTPPLGLGTIIAGAVDIVVALVQVGDVSPGAASANRHDQDNSCAANQK